MNKRLMWTKQKHTLCLGNDQIFIFFFSFSWIQKIVEKMNYPNENYLRFG